MKKCILSMAIGAITLAPSQAAPFMAVGSSAELFVTAKAGFEINDNVTLGSDYAVSGQQPSNPIVNDTMWRFAPGLSFEFGKNALLSGRFAYTETFDTYSDNSDLDSTLSDVSFNAKHDDGKSKTSFKASFRQQNQNTVDSRSPTLSRRDVVNVGGEHEMEISAKSGLLFGFDYTDTDYARASFTDRTRTEIPVRYLYELTPKVDLTIGAQYREITSDTLTAESTDMFYSVGARGEFTPKLSGYLRVGYTDRDLKAGGKRSTYGLASDFTYRYSEKSSLTFGASNDFGTSGTGESQENLDIFVGIRSNLTPALTIASRVSLRQIDYFTRDGDDYMEGSVSGEYTYNEYLKVIASLSLKNNDSGQLGGDFDNTVFSITAQLRY